MLKDPELGLKLPVPELVHTPALVVDIPLREIPTFEHTTWSLPAFTARVLTYTTVIVRLTLLHPPLLVEVKVSVTLPLVVSATEGKYTGFNKLLEENVPVPDEAHIPAPVVEEPFSCKLGLLLHTTCGFGPGTTTGAGEMVTTFEFETGKQFPFPVLESESVNDPPEMSAALGV